jgi:hypothetical protein
MARGLMTALQAALAGVSGGATGYAKYQQQEQERKRQMKEEERAALRDALAQSQFGLEQQRFEAQFGPEAIARQERTRKEGLANTLEAARISATAAAQRDAAEAARKTKEQSEMGLAWYTKTMSDPNVPQATKNALGLRITEAQQRAGGRLRPEDIGSIASQYMGAEMAERKLGAEEERSGVVRPGAGGGTGAPAYSRMAPTDGGSYGATTGGAGKPSLDERMRQLKSQGVSMVEAQRILASEGYSLP